MIKYNEQHRFVRAWLNASNALVFKEMTLGQLSNIGESCDSIEADVRDVLIRMAWGSLPVNKQTWPNYMPPCLECGDVDLLGWTMKHLEVEDLSRTQLDAVGHCCDELKERIRERKEIFASMERFVRGKREDSKESLSD